MLKNISNLGKVLNKAELNKINGGAYLIECVYDDGSWAITTESYAWAQYYMRACRGITSVDTVGQ